MYEIRSWNCWKPSNNVWQMLQSLRLPRFCFCSGHLLPHQDLCSIGFAELYALVQGLDSHLTKQELQVLKTEHVANKAQCTASNAGGAMCRVLAGSLQAWLGLKNKTSVDLVTRLFPSIIMQTHTRTQESCKETLEPLSHKVLCNE